MNDMPEQPPYQKGRRKMRPITKKELDSRFYCDRVLSPLASWVHGHRGAMAEVIRRVASYLGKPIQRQQIERWLNRDDQQRVEPSFGHGLVLVRVIRTMRSEFTAGTAPPFTSGALTVDPSLIEVDKDDLPEAINYDELANEPEAEAEKKGVTFFLRKPSKRSGS